MHIYGPDQSKYTGDGLGLEFSLLGRAGPEGFLDRSRRIIYGPDVYD
jgi:hypothetical protein